MKTGEQIKHELLTDRSKETVNHWAKYLAEHPNDIESCLPLLKEDDPIPMRIAWVLDHIVDYNPEVMLKHVSYLYSLKDDMSFPGYRRNLTRIMASTGIPESMESEVIDTLFKWVLDADTALAIKVHSIQTLYNICNKYPELSGELIDVIEDQIPKSSVGFKSRGNKIIAKLKKRMA